MILAELRRVLHISEARGEEMVQDVIKGVTQSDCNTWVTLV